MSGTGDYISREALVNEIWKALYSYEDEMEAKFMADPELDVSQWFFHRIFVQTMSSIDLQVILDAPAADVVEVDVKDFRMKKVIQMLSHYYSVAKKSGRSEDPLSYALYMTWRIVNAMSEAHHTWS